MKKNPDTEHKGKEIVTGTCSMQPNPMQVGQNEGGFHVAPKTHFPEWDLSHFSAEGFPERGKHWTQQHFLSVHSSLFTNISGPHHAETATSKEGSLAYLQQTSLGLGTLFLPDINTTTAPVIFSTQGEASSIATAHLDQHGEIPSDFVFQSPPKRGQPKGSKSKKNMAKITTSTQELFMGQGMDGKSTKRDFSLISVDPVETAKSFGTGKKI